MTGEVLRSSWHEACERADAERAARQTRTDWPDPKPIKGGLAGVDDFNIDFMPAALGPWVDDISNRLQCPPDYVAVAAITALGALIGRRAGIRPQYKTDWIEIPNIWGCFIGRPGMLKSPAMEAALSPRAGGRQGQRDRPAGVCRWAERLQGAPAGASLARKRGVEEEPQRAPGC